jgi:hypothetical protein
VALVFEVCMPSNVTASFLTPFFQLFLYFPTLLLLRILCFRAFFGIRCSSILIIPPGHSRGFETVCFYGVSLSAALPNP